MSNQNVITLESIKKNIENFNKMLSEENSELIKISYWSLLEQQFKLYVERNGTLGCVELVFQAIFAKNIELLKLKNLYYLIVNFSRNTDHDMFIKHFFLFANEMLRNYSDSKTIFNEFLFDFAFSIMVEKDLNNHSEIIRNFFLTFFEVDKTLVIYTLVKYVSCQDNLTCIFENNGNFNFIYKKYFKKLAKTQLTELILVMIENFHTYVLNFTLKIMINNKNIVDVLPLRSLKLVEIISYMIKTLKKINISNIDNFNFTIKQYYISIFQKIFLILKSFDKSFFSNSLIEEYLLFLIEFCIQKNLFIPDFIDFFSDYIDIKFTVFIETLLTYLYTVSNEFYERNSFEKIVKLILSILNLDCQKSIIFKLLPKLLFKKFEQQNKFKQISTLFNIKLYEEFNKEHFIKTLYKDCEYSNDELAFHYYKNYEKYPNINDMNLINFILKRSFSYTSNENLEVNTILLNKYLDVTFSLNLERYNQVFKNFSLNFFSHLTLLFMSDQWDILEKVISKMRNYPDKMYIKTTIYPLILSFLQSIYIDKFFDNIEVYSKMNRLLFNLLFEYCREDSISNILYKLLTRLYQLPNSKIFANKDLALELFNDMIIKKNSTKFVDIFFKFIISNIKKDANNIDIKYINYKYLYKYCQNYECSLLSELEQYMTECFDKKLEILYNFSNGYSEIDTLFTLSCVLEIIKKEESKNIIDKIFEYFNTNKLIKIVNNFLKHFQYFGSENLVNILGHYKFCNLLDIHDIFAIQENLMNKEIITLLILRILSQIFSLFLRNIITKNSEQLKDRKNYTTNQTIMQIFKNFDFLSGNIINGENSIFNISIIIYINEMFANYENLIFFYNTYSSYKSMHLVEENNLDLSLLNDVNNKLIHESNKKLFEIFSHSKNFSLLADFLNSIFKFESKFFEKKDVQDSTNFVIEDLNQTFHYENSTMKLENQYIFSKIFIEKVFEIDDTFQDIQEFLLFDNTILKYFKNHLKLLNPQFVIIIIYNVLKQISNHSIETKDSILKNIYSLLSLLIRQNKAVFITLLRLYTNEITFKKFCIDNKISKELISIIEFILKQTILFNSYKATTFSYIIKSLDIIEGFIYNLSYEDEEFISNCVNYQTLMINIILFLNEKIKNEKKEIELSKKTLEQIQDNINKRIAKFLNFLIGVWRNCCGSIYNKKDFFDLLFVLIKFLYDNNMKINLLNETTNENKVIIDFLNLFNEIKELNKLNLILNKVLGEENKEYKHFFINLIVYFRASNVNNNKFAYDSIQSLLFNKEYEKFDKKNKILMISLLTIYFIIEKNNLNMFISNYKELALLSVFMLHNISNRLDLDKTMNFPKKNILLD